jgi:dihydroorotate dehydrogenase
MYSLIRPFLFHLEAEKAHHLALKSLHVAPACWFSKPKGRAVSALGLEFPHPLGLAAGLDKNGEHLDALAKLGFSFIEVGTVTPKPQDGNPKPRLFRLPAAEAIINRMGFNNKGVDALISNIQKANYQGILGINIGKNKDTSLDMAVDDYLFCMRRVYPHASYITINISSPNTPDLRQLQHVDYFLKLMKRLREEQLILADLHQHHVPLVVKLSPDEKDDTLKQIAEVLVTLGIEGIIATNTTCEREAVSSLQHGGESGGLSGPPLALRATQCLRVLKGVVGGDLTLIGVGGINNADSAKEKLLAGASLLQIYTGLIFQGPGLVSDVVDGITGL